MRQSSLVLPMHGLFPWIATVEGGGMLCRQVTEVQLKKYEHLKQESRKTNFVSKVPKHWFEPD